MTPEIASDPYCAAAPSRRTSILPTALVGIRSMSTGVDPPGDAREIVDQRCRMPPLAIDEHEHIVTGKSPDRDRPDTGRGPAAAQRRHAQRGDDVAEYLLETGAPGILQFLRADHVDRHGAVRHRTLDPAARAGDDDSTGICLRCSAGGGIGSHFCSGRRNGDY